MSELAQEFRVWEIMVRSLDASKEDRAQAGDILSIRKPLPYIGRKEGTEVIWLKIEGIEDTDAYRLVDIHKDVNGVIANKCRYCIPFDRLKDTIPGFDVARANDPNDMYQPFYLYDEESHVFFTIVEHIPVLNVAGLIFDKQEQRFL